MQAFGAIETSRRRTRWLGLALCIVLLAGLARAASRSGEEAALASAPGGVVVVHLWATWCGACTEELDALADFYRGPYRGLAERGLRLVTVSQDVRERDLERYLDEHDPPFPVFLDSFGEIGDRLALRGLPATVVLDERGAVLARMLGAQDWGSPSFHARLQGFLPE